MDELVENLRQLGLNSYEAKVYLALLKKYPATGYEVSRLADIPQSRAYDTLKSLVVDGLVTSSTSKPITYTPIKPRDLINRYKRKIGNTLTLLEKKLPSVKPNHLEPIFDIQGLYLLREKIIGIINNARREVFIAVWGQDFKYFEQELLNAYNRGLEVKIVGYDAFVCNFGSLSRHVTGRDIIPSLGGRMIFIAADNSEGFWGKIGPADKDANVRGIWTQNAEVVFLIKSFIVQDMYLTDIAEQFPEQLKYFYGPGLKKLRDKILVGAEFPKL